MPQKCLFDTEWSNGLFCSLVLVQSEWDVDKYICTLHVEPVPLVKRKGIIEEMKQQFPA